MYISEKFHQGRDYESSEAAAQRKIFCYEVASGKRDLIWS
jgi:hypothetical protein